MSRFGSFVPLCCHCEKYHPPCRPDLCIENLVDEVKRLRDIEDRAIDIQVQANLAADHRAYDLMRTILGD